ncbi:hypothetical protein WDU94_013542, partial [Cyamophila willieti]
NSSLKEHRSIDLGLVPLPSFGISSYFIFGLVSDFCIATRISTINMDFSLLSLCFLFGFISTGDGASTKLGADHHELVVCLVMTILAERKRSFWGFKYATKPKFDMTNYTVERFKGEFKKIFEKTMKTSSIDGIDPFLRFIKAYKDQGVRNKKNLKSFFEEYTVPFDSKENPTGFIIDVFHELIRSNEDFKIINMYLVTAFIQPPYTNISEVFILFKMIHEEKSRFLEHVAGVLQFQLDGRTGYVLVDPGYRYGYDYLPFAIFLMDDEEAPHNIPIVGFKADTLKFQMGAKLSKSNPFAIVEHTGTDENLKVVYYLEKPFCSFMTTISKGMLVRQQYSLVTRDEEGISRSVLEFGTHSLSDKPTPDQTNFLLGRLNSSTKEMDYSPVPFASILKDNVDSDAKYLDSQQLDLMRNVWNQVFKDPALLKEMKTVASQFWILRDSPPGKGKKGAWKKFKRILTLKL